MHLISLSANHPSFKEVIFKNETGLNFIVASQKEAQSTENTGKTYNGVGKSLIVGLIDFCLGSSEKDDLANKLPGWEFTLKFKFDGKLHSSTRRVDDQSTIIFDDKKMKVRKFTDYENHILLMPTNLMLLHEFRFHRLIRSHIVLLQFFSSYLAPSSLS